MPEPTSNNQDSDGGALETTTAIPVVVISSTARDLPEHREQVMHACLRVKVLPTMMEDLPASADDAIAASMKLVDEANIYVGVFAHRYGYVPEGHEKSITVMEYERAVERGIPRLIFLMSDDHLVTGKDVETGGGAARLGAPEPVLEPFDASKHDPMPDVELNPPDEFAED